MQDGVAVEAEQVGYERHFEAPVIELNPAVLLFQKLTIKKWEEFLDKRPLKKIYSTQIESKSDENEFNTQHY
uniref:Uncharacterized protein n=1 Tax=Oscillatoriales cyanobacterium SpSt-402 TaxID=2282168 RepID=A0A832H3M3_9CYAN